MSTATITSKGQTTIPKEVREHLRLSAGDRVEFVMMGDVVMLRPATRAVTELKGLLPRPRKAVSVDAMNAAVKRRAAR